MGDVFLSGAYPFADVDNGGDFDGVIEFCRAVLGRIDESTVIVPGHGRTATYADLERYIEMLVTVRGRIAALIADGATLAQVVAAQPTKEWDERTATRRRSSSIARTRASRTACEGRIHESVPTCRAQA